MKNISKVVIAVDSFKGSMSAKIGCEAITRGIKSVNPDIETISIPMADGGEGTSQALVDATGGKISHCSITGPLGERAKGFYGVLGGNSQVAAVEMAAASGLPMVPADKRNPLNTTTFGTGELIRAALDEGVKKIIVCLGGSATNDAGCGMAQALGVKFYNKQGKLITMPITGGLLADVADMDISSIDPRIAECEFEVACDVDNPLLGPRGASATFGPQKGATEKIVQILEANLANAADIIEHCCGKAVRNLPGAGAAGGLGAALVAFTNAVLKPGIDIVLAATNFEAAIANSELIITGEGKIDATTLSGKTISGICRKAAAAGVDTIAMAGLVADRPALAELKLVEICQISPPEMPVEIAMQKGVKLLEAATVEVFSKYVHD